MPVFRGPFSTRTFVVGLTIILLIGVSSQLPPSTSSPTYNASVAAFGVADAQAHNAGTSPGQPAIEGWLTDAVTGTPLANGLISLSDTVTARTGREGYFSFSVAQVRQFIGEPANEPIQIDASVHADSYADWHLADALYYPGDTLRLYPKLKSEAARPSAFVAAKPGSLGDAEMVESPFSEVASSQLAIGINAQPLGQTAARLTPPSTIRVYRTQTGVVEVVPFRNYVKHVLPLEWIPTWGAESLKSGAMASKMYAWYWISRGGKRGDLGADLKDNTDDQVYDPNVSYASTDAAVDATYNYALTLNGALFQTQYCAGSYSGEGSGACPWQGSAMSQWGTAYFADRGRSWGWITEFYYAGSVISPGPPGGGYDGTPVATSVPRATYTPVPPASNFSVGQSATRPDLFQDAYDRNGGAAALGRPTGAVRWWLNYLSENNVVVQPFSGPDGRGNTWIVYDVLKASSIGVQKAFVLYGPIANEYAMHNPVGPEWIGAPTSDPYLARGDQGGLPCQGFTRGTLAVAGSNVQFSPWPQQFSGWKAEYFAGHVAESPQQGPSYALPGQPALVRDLATPSFDWSSTPGAAPGMGVGKRDWSLQLTEDFGVVAGSYDFTAGTDGGFRLWIDGVLALNSWQDRQGLQTLTHNADLANGTHTIRMQYYNLGAGGKFQFTMALRGTGAGPTSSSGTQGKSALRVRVQWLGRQQAPADSWVQPLMLFLSAPDNPAVLGSYGGVTDRNGVAFYQNLPVGKYDVHVKGPHSLQSARASISLAANSTADLDMKAQVEGDFDGDNCVTVDDFSAVQSMLGTNRDMPGFVSAADLNNDGVVAMNDVSLLRSGFDRCGDISADNEFRVMSANAAPSLSQALSPWLNPSTLQHSLGLALATSNTTVKEGQVVTIDVVAQTGSQAIDGAAFVLKYDPQRFGVVDSSGNGTTRIEPGLALPSVMGNWVDANGGAIGYAAGILQGDTPSGRVVIATVRLRALISGAPGSTLVNFASGPSPHMQLTNGGENLLAKTTDLTLSLSR